MEFSEALSRLKALDLGVSRFSKLTHELLRYVGGLPILSEEDRRDCLRAGIDPDALRLKPPEQGNAPGKSRCSCARTIEPADVITFKFYERMVKPYFVYVKFNCPECRSVGERFLTQEQWEQGLNMASPLGMHFMRIKPKAHGTEAEPPAA